MIVRSVLDDEEAVTATEFRRLRAGEPPPPTPPTRALPRPAAPTPDPPTAWLSQAACRGVDPGLWYPAVGESTGAARAVCRACPVRADCLHYALEGREKFGICGGLSERERRTVRRRGLSVEELAEWAEVEQPDGATVLCEVCGGEFLPGAGLKNHQRQVHRDPADEDTSAASDRRGEAIPERSPAWRRPLVVERPTLPLPGVDVPGGRTVRACEVCGKGFVALGQHQRNGHHRPAEEQLAS